MKNWLKSLTVVAAIALVIIPCVLFSACSSGDHIPAKGDVYVLESVECKWSADAKVPEEMRSEFEAQAKASMKGMKVTIISDTEVEMTSPAEEDAQKGTYTIDGKKITVDMDDEGKMEFTIKGKTFVGEMENNGMTIVMTFKLSK